MNSSSLILFGCGHNSLWLIAATKLLLSVLNFRVNMIFSSALNRKLCCLSNWIYASFLYPACKWWLNDVFFSGYNDNGARSMAREQSDECGKTRFLSLDLLYNGGVGWSWYVLCWKTTVLFVVVFNIHIPPTKAFLGLYKFQISLWLLKISLKYPMSSLKWVRPI